MPCRTVRNPYVEQLQAVLREVTVSGPGSYSCFGRQTRMSPRGLLTALTPETIRACLLDALQSDLYRDFYCRGGVAVEAPLQRAGLPTFGRQDLSAALSAANLGSGHWQAGWEVESVEGGNALMTRDGLRMLIETGDQDAAPGTSILPGAMLRVRVPKELRTAIPGFYLAVGDDDMGSDPVGEIVRWYWNLDPGGAVEVTRLLTGRLNAAGLPFQLKCLTDPAQYWRCDAVVLYVRKDDHAAVVEVVQAVHRQLLERFALQVPALSKPVATGLGVAEDPGSGQSFGTHRCHVLADGIIRAVELRRRSLAERLAVITECFKDADISLEQPYLNPESQDIYVEFGDGARPHHTAPTVCTDGRDTAAFQRQAVELGRGLVETAYWHGGRCNWLGPDPAIRNPVGGQTVGAWAALGPALYSGTSGVATFLAELDAATAMPGARKTALGALRDALARLDLVPQTARLGLFTGWTGIAYAAARVGAVLGEEWLLRAAARLVERCRQAHQRASEFDLISGRAGAVVACLAMRSVLDGPGLLEFARLLGNELLNGANNTRRGLSWSTPGYRRQRDLTGLAHGAAGAGLALLELYEATGAAEYRQGAERSFAYERSWFDSRASNWPDFREGAAIGARRAFAASWCHGAPGIALSRLRAWTLLHDQTCRAEAEIAIATTHRAVEAMLDTRRDDWSLCHGLCGNAEILALASQLLGAEETQHIGLARAVAATGIRRHEAPGQKWPCGATAGDSPGLMLGLAGVGLFYLRMSDALIPSVLLPSISDEPVGRSPYPQAGQADLPQRGSPNGGLRARDNQHRGTVLQSAGTRTRLP